jgi:hypothetical protein
MTHPISVFDGDMMFAEFQKDTAVTMDRLITLGCMPVAVAIREDLWPGIMTWLGYPVVRLTATSHRPWGVLT